MSTTNLAIASLAALSFAAIASAQAPITWSVKTLSGAKADVSTKGKLCLAVNLGPETCEKVVNGVHFQADRAHWTRKRLVDKGPIVRGVMYWPKIVSGGFTLTVPYNRAAPNIGARDTNDASYDHILKDGRHSPGGTQVITCSIDGLTPGAKYEIQIFYGNKSRPTRITEWDNGVGGREGKGGIFLRPLGPLFGQVATGTFTATKSGKQTFTNYQQTASGNLKTTHNACNAIQIRDITPRPLRARATYYGEGTPGTDRQINLGGTKCSPAIALTGHPVLNKRIALTAENSSGVASVAVYVFGFAPLNVKVLGGTLLVTPTVTLPLPMPAPKSPFVHDHELSLPYQAPGAVTIYAQVVQLDKGAPGGLAFSPGLKIENGFAH